MPRSGHDTSSIKDGRDLASETTRALECGHYILPSRDKVSIREPKQPGAVLADAPAWEPSGSHALASGSCTPRIFGCGSFAAAQWLLDHDHARRCAVLDFASDSEPGGGWRGRQQGTQEESLCRASSLGRALERLPYPLPQYGIAHVPEVLVIRDDADRLLAAPFTVGVLAAALRDVGGDGEPDAKQRQHLQRKVRGVLAAAAALGYDGLVLGSWGCGAFGNAHELVARAFGSELHPAGGRFGHAFGAVGFADPRAAGREAFRCALTAMGIEVAVEAVGTGAGHGGGAGGGGGGGGAAGGLPPAPQRWLSDVYGKGASVHAEAELVAWREKGLEAAEAVRRGAWGEAVAAYEQCVQLRPEWEKGHACLARAVERQRQAQQDAGSGGGGGGDDDDRGSSGGSSGGSSSGGGAATAAADGGGRGLATTATEATAATAATAAAATAAMPSAAAAAAASPPPPQRAARVKGVRLLPHEAAMLASGELQDVTHEGANAAWLRAESAVLADPARELVYRPMGDREFAHLLEHGTLPATQPYQTIVRGESGRAYAEKYLNGQKWVDSAPTTVVELAAPAALIDELFARQCKPEEGCLSHGLGDKGGKGLPRFNASLESGATRWRVVLVKRKPVKK